jgi:Fe-S cluster assembly iron-binding protein IscA
MLRITDDARTLICTLTATTATTGRSGLRIVVNPVHNSLSMSVARAPEPSDSVVSRGQARVFLSPSASRRLHRRTLRAEVSETRSAFFLGS